MGVAVAGLGHEHNRWLVPAARRHIAHVGAADFLRQVFLSGEEHLDILVHTSAAVPADVDHHAVAIGVFAEQVGIHRAERLVGHRWDVYVAQTATRPALHVGGTLFHPALIQQSALLGGRDWLNNLLDFLARGCGERHERLLSGKIPEDSGKVGLGGKLL